MRRVWSLLLALSMVLCLSACGDGAAGSKGEVNVYNWGEYLDEDILRQFEEETGIKVNYSTYSDNESMYAVLKSGAADYDVIIPSDST